MYYRKFNDGWFGFYYNIHTGERKFKLDDGDIDVTNLEDGLKLFEKGKNTNFINIPIESYDAPKMSSDYRISCNRSEMNLRDE